MPFEVEIKTTKGTRRLLKEMPKAIRAGLKKGMHRVMVKAKKDAKDSFGTAGKPDSGPRNILRDSIKFETRLTANILKGKLFSDVIYSRIQEKGGTIKAKRGGYLSFAWDGAGARVKSVRLKARPYLEPAIQEHLSEIEDLLTDLVWEEVEAI